MSFDLFSGKLFYKGPSAGSFYEALKLETKRCVDEEIIQNVEAMYETSIDNGYRSGSGVLFKVKYKPISKEGTWGKVVHELEVLWTLEHKISVNLICDDFSTRRCFHYCFPIGDKRVQINLNKSFRYWISNLGQAKYNLEESLDSYLNSLSHSSLQWPNRVQGTTSSQFQTNYLSPSNFINPHSSYYSYR